MTYSGIQNRAKDTQIRQAVSQIEKAIRQYSIISEVTTFKGGSGSSTPAGPTGCTNGGGAGFFGTGVYGVNTCTVEDTLVVTGALPAGFTQQLPRNPHFGAPSDHGERSIMLYPCASVKYIPFWTLYSPSDEDAASITETQAACGYGTMQRDSWGMRAARVIQL